MQTERPPQDWEEGRRLRGWQLYPAGWSQRRIAEALGVSQGIVSRWIVRAQAGKMHCIHVLPLERQCVCHRSNVNS